LPEPLDQTGLLCNPLYETKEPLGRDKKGNPRVSPGQLIWAHQVYPPNRPMIIEVQGYDPRDPSKTSYVFRKYDPAKPPGSHFPVKELNLRSDENLYVMQGKLRPAIVLQTITTDYYNQQNPEPYVWTAPCFTFKDKHKQDYRCRIAAMQYPHLFYLPAHPSGFSEEGVLRFEHIQPIATDGVQPVFCNSKQSFLSDTAWAVLQHRLSLFMTGKVLDASLDETVRAYAECLLEAYGLH
jgi:hypothetical protein